MTGVPLSAATIDLTPDRPLPMGGFHGAERLSRETSGRLEANLLVLGTGATAIVMIAIDTLFAGADLTERLIKACETRFGVGPERVLVLASHTHFAPMLDTGKPLLGRCDVAELHRCGDVITRTIDALQPSVASGIRHGKVASEAGVNRRLKWRWPTMRRLLGRVRSDIYMCDNVAGPHDPRLRTWVWLDSSGIPLAAMWSFACHPVFFPHSDTASPDYVGVVREALRQHLGRPDLPVIFAAGCMGDVWPRSPRPWLTLSRLPRFALYGPLPVAYGPSDWSRWANELASAAVEADSRAGEGPLADVADARLVRVPLARLLDDDNAGRTLTAKALRAPGLGRIIALGCEPVSEIAGMVGKPEDLVLGYEGDVFGYLPTAAMTVQGGYEPYDSRVFFGLLGEFRPDLDRTLVEIGEALAEV